MTVVSAATFLLSFLRKDHSMRGANFIRAGPAANGQQQQQQQSMRHGMPLPLPMSQSVEAFFTCWVQWQMVSSAHA
jgi:hypothetical protein